MPRPPVGMAWPSASSRAERSTLGALLDQPFIAVRIDLRWGFCRDRMSSLLQAALRLRRPAKWRRFYLGLVTPGGARGLAPSWAILFRPDGPLGIRLLIRLLKVQNPGLRVALDWLDFSPSLKNIAVTFLVLRHVQGDPCVGLAVEDESGSEGEISKKFLIHDSSF